MEGRANSKGAVLNLLLKFMKLIPNIMNTYAQGSVKGLLLVHVTPATTL